MSSRKESQKSQPTLKAVRKQRLLNENETLEDFVTRLNGKDPPVCVTKKVDLTKCKANREFLNEFLYKEFEIKQLVKNDIDTHYGSCSLCTIANEKELFFQIGRPDCNVKASILAKHAYRNHGRKQGLPISRKRKAQSDSQPAKRLKLCTPTQQDLNDVADQNLRVLSTGQVKSLNLFADPEFIRRDELVLKAHGVDPSSAKSLSKSRPTTRRAIFDKTEAQRRMIQEQVPVIAKNFGGVGWSFDHKVRLQ